MNTTSRQAEEFIYHESRLLDERKFDEWLNLFTKSGIYWILIDENADPASSPSITYDDSSLREQRVYQLMNLPHYAQIPPSRTVHILTNITVDNEAYESQPLIARCNMLVFELRPGDPLQFGLGEQRSFVGHCEYRLEQNEPNQLFIAMKKIVLINRDLPISNLSFIL